jgi:hypothetical protein
VDVSAPQRIQRKRTKGWRQPEGAVYVGRPTKWGNPFPVHGGVIHWAARALGYRANAFWQQAVAVALYRWWLTGEKPIRGDQAHLNLNIELTEGRSGGALYVEFHGWVELPVKPSLAPLRGKDLACWCPLEDENGNRVPCHADVLLELANR